MELKYDNEQVINQENKVIDYGLDVRFIRLLG